MPSFARLQILGHLGQDPRTFTTSSGTEGVSLSVAVSQGKDKPAQWCKATVWGGDSAFSKMSISIAKSLTKGDLVLIDGKPTVEAWQSKQTGNPEASLCVTANFVYDLSRKSRDGGQHQAAQTQQFQSDEDCPF